MRTSTSTTPNLGLWNINSDPTTSPGPAFEWYPSGNPGFRAANYGHGGAWAPWSVGSGNFSLSFTQNWELGNVLVLSGVSYTQGIPVLNGQAISISTDPIGSQGPNSYNIDFHMNQNGMMIDVRQGSPYYLQAVGTTSSGTFTRNNGDLFVSAMAGQTVYFRQNPATTNQGSCVIGTVIDANHLTYGSCSTTITNNSSVYMMGDQNLTQNLDTPIGGQAPIFPFGQWSIPWFVGDPLANNPPITVNISRVGNVITWNVYTSPTGLDGKGVTGLQAAMQLGSGTIPIGINAVYNFVDGNTTTLTGAAATANFGYVNIVNINNDHTGWIGGQTSPYGSPVAPGGGQQYVSRLGNIHGYGAISSGTVPTITSIIATATAGSATVIQAGNSVTVNGTNLNAGVHVVRIGIGSNLQTAATTFVSSSRLTVFTAPSETNGTYHFSVIDPSGVDISYPPGITLFRSGHHPYGPARVEHGGERCDHRYRGRVRLRHYSDDR